MYIISMYFWFTSTHLSLYLFIFSKRLTLVIVNDFKRKYMGRQMIPFSVIVKCVFDLNEFKTITLQELYIFWQQLPSV